MSQPTHKQIAEVHAILYKPSRFRAFKDHVDSIAVEMNLRPDAELAPTDIRGPAGSGPNWVIPSTRAIDPAVLDAAGRCDKLAAILIEAASELDGVTISDADRGHLQTALREEAKVWTLRGQWWRDPNPSADPETLAATIAGHVAASIAAGTKVHAYRKTLQEVENRS